MTDISTPPAAFSQGVLEEKIRDTICSFANLPDGWHYGTGTGAVHAAVDAALNVNSLLVDCGARNIEVFPDIDGGILVSGYRDRHTLEILCRPDGGMDLVYEVDDDLVNERSSISIDEIEEFLGGSEWFPTKLFAPLHPIYFSKEMGRFISMAFQPSSRDGGISAFETQCAIDLSGCECHHIHRFYRGVAGHPYVFWRISPDILSEDCRVTCEPSTTGDTCHRNLHGLGNNRRKKMVRSLKVEELEICYGETHRPLTSADTELFGDIQSTPPL